MRNRIMEGKWLGPMLAIALAGLLLFIACAPKAPVEEEKVVEVGFMAGLTGPAAAASQYAFRTAVDYTEYFNEEDGIPEVTVKLTWADTGYKLDQAVGTYRKWAQKGLPIFILVLMEETTVLSPMAAKDELPYITLAQSESAMYPPGWVYSIYPTEAERFSAWCDWIMENWQGERPPRVAFLGADMAYGREAEAQGTKYAGSIGIEMLPMEFVPVVPLDATAQLLRLSERGADFVYVTGIWSTALPIMRDAQRLGLVGEMRFGGYENTQSRALLEALGPDAEGYLCPRVAPWVEEVEIPGIKLVRDLQMKYRGRLDVQGDEAHGFRAAYVAFEAVKRAIGEVGYENVDGAAVNRALLSMKDFDPYGIGPITYTADDHRGSNRVSVYQVKGGEVVPVADWREAPMLAP